MTHDVWLIVFVVQNGFMFTAEGVHRGQEKRCGWLVGPGWLGFGLFGNGWE